MRPFVDGVMVRRLVERYRPVAKSIATKYTRSDPSLRDDCIQVALIGLLTIDIARLPQYNPAEPDVFLARTDAYLRNVLRNRILSFLSSAKTASWSHARTEWRVIDGTSQRARIPSRHEHLSTLQDLYSFDINDDGEVFMQPVAE